MPNRYKLIAGGMVLSHPTLKQATGRPLDVMVKPGDVVVCEEDLVARFGTGKVLLVGPAPAGEQADVCLTVAPPGSVERTGGVVTVASLMNTPTTLTPAGTTKSESTDNPITQYEPLEDRTVTDLREIAATEEIDLAGCHNKADVIKALRG